MREAAGCGRTGRGGDVVGALRREHGSRIDLVGGNKSVILPL